MNFERFAAIFILYGMTLWAGSFQSIELADVFFYWPSPHGNGGWMR